MPERSRDDEREERITMESIVDAYDPEEQALGWYYYIENNLTAPFRARCIAERPISPLRVGEEVEVIGMPPEDDCRHEIFVLVRWEGRRLGVPLSQLEGIAVDEETRRAIEDWRYWVGRGYQL